MEAPLPFSVVAGFDVAVVIHKQSGDGDAAVREEESVGLLGGVRGVALVAADQRDRSGPDCVLFQPGLDEPVGDEEVAEVDGASGGGSVYIASSRAGSGARPSHPPAG